MLSALSPDKVCFLIVKLREFGVQAEPNLGGGSDATDDQFVAVAGEVGRQHLAEILLRRSVGRAVIVGEIEVGDAAVERAAEHRAAGLEHVGAAEILPQAERDQRQVEAASPASAVAHPAVIS